MPQDYYTKVTLVPMDVMDYLHPALANAFKYLVRAGAKPDNSYEQDIRKAYDYINHYFMVRGMFREDPRAVTILKLYLSKNPVMHGIEPTDFDTVEKFFLLVREHITDFLAGIMDENFRKAGYNVAAKLMHKKLPYPNIDCPVKDYKSIIELMNQENEDGDCEEKRNASSVQQGQDS